MTATDDLAETVAEYLADVGTPYAPQATLLIRKLWAEVARLRNMLTRNCDARIAELEAEVERLQAAGRDFVAFVDSYAPDSVLRREHATLYDLLLRYAADFRAVSPAPTEGS